MHNDDSTLVVLSELSKTDSVDIEHEDNLEALQNQEGNMSTDSPADTPPQSPPEDQEGATSCELCKTAYQEGPTKNIESDQEK